MVADNYIRRFKVKYAVDGDTVRAALVDFGYGFMFVTNEENQIDYRLRRVNCPESNRPESKEAGLAAKDYTIKWLLEHQDDKGYLYADTTPDKPGGKIKDSFGRYLAEITDALGNNLSDALLTSGHAVPYKKK